VTKLHRLRRVAYAIFAVCALVGLASAAIPGQTGVIDGCHDAKRGTLRLIDTDAGETCSAKETLVSWNERGPSGAAGPPGPQGAAGPAGPVGPAGAANLEVVEASSGPRNSDTMKTASVFCPPGKLATGGGATFEGDDSTVFTAPVRFLNSVPHLATSAISGKLFSYGWFAAGAETDNYGGNWGIRVYAICADATLAP
jgi:hypothetical protein